MISFEKMLENLIDESEYGITKLSEEIGYNKTMLGQVIRGKKKMSRDKLLKLCSLLSLSDEEQRVLLEQYDRDEIGSDVYDRCMAVCDLIKQTSYAIQFKASGYPGSMGSLAADKPPAIEVRGTVRLGSAVEVYMALASVLELKARAGKKVRVRISSPAKFPQVGEIFKNALFSGVKMETEHIVQFEPNTPSGVANNLNQMLMLAPKVIATSNCQKVYYLVYQAAGDSRYNQYKYSVIIDDVLLLADLSFSKGLLINDPVIVKDCSEYFDGLIKAENGARPLLEVDNSPISLIKHYSSILDLKNSGASDVFSFMNSTPPVHFAYDNKTMTSKAKFGSSPFGITRSALSLLVSKYEKSRNVKMQIFFTLEGMREFLENGYATEFPQSVMRFPFDMTERLMLLDKYIEAIEKDEPCYIIDSSIIEFPKNVSILFPGGKISVSLFNADAYDFGMGTLNIEEGSIVRAFVDFFENIPKTGLVLSKEEALARLGKLREEFSGGGF